MKVAHPIEYQSWDPDLVNDLEYENRGNFLDMQTVNVIILH